ncbi:hypothetical protein EV700_2173 [Fluviicoccus keumensis]|uniref:Uncharacterized protein n=1 Tax=Fluviicoccus keumensis TaxID=1435465 RepID=A0A4Q7Z6I0_9GAMM|nr:hypothetical protein [Fluviicoccus keumensis]RZU45353.1 hypothetical protein EV700_2173 [Fluviicoccus keumensis]
MNIHEVCIWDAKRFGKPKDMDQAAALRQQPVDAPSAAMLAFAAEVEQSAKALLDEAEGLDELTGLEAAMQQSPHAGFVVTMPYFSWQPVLLMLGETAVKHGLVLVDGEVVAAYVPPGKVIPAEAARALKKMKEMYEGDDALPATLKQFEAWVEPIIEMALKPHGFTQNPDKKHRFQKATYYERNVGVGCQYLYMIYQKYSNGYFMLFNMEMACENVLSIYGKFPFFESESIMLCTYNTEIMSKRNPILTKCEAINLVDETLRCVINIFDSAVDIKGLDAVVNGEIDVLFRNHLHNFFYMPHCLIVARLAGNPHFEELVLSLRKGRTPGANADAMMTEWPKLVEYLRNEVKPLV